MTGGQMAPTTLLGMKTTSSPMGRDVETSGFPIKICELLATMDGATYIARRSLHNPTEIRKAKKAIKQAFENQLHGYGFSLVELLSSLSHQLGCDTGRSVEADRDADGAGVSVGDFKSVKLTNAK
jgi:2-oxoglutarate ferredoxin oxidoreductase subunit beta